jgi:hypothetical protein
MARADGGAGTRLERRRGIAGLAGPVLSG